MRRTGFFPARVTIGNWHNTQDDSPIRIEIENDRTGRMVAEVRMSYAEFAQAVCGVSGCKGMGKKWPVRKAK